MGYIEELSFPELSKKGRQEESCKTMESLIHNIKHPARNIAGATSVMSHILHKPAEKEQLTTKLNEIIDKTRVVPYALYPTYKPSTISSSVNYGMEPIHTCIRTYIGQEMKRSLFN